MDKLLPYGRLFDYAKCNVLLDVASWMRLNPYCLQVFALYLKFYILNYDYKVVYVVYLFLLEFL